MIVGALVHAADRVLLCQRAIEPQYGKWTLPAGFMEMHETTAQGAMREMREEAGAEATLQRLYSLVDVPHLGQTHLIYRATLNHEQFYPGEETLALAMFSEAEVPWEDIAFESVRFTLEKFFIDVALQHFDVHVAVGDCADDSI